MLGLVLLAVLVQEVAQVALWADLVCTKNLETDLFRSEGARDLRFAAKNKQTPRLEFTGADLWLSLR